MMNNIHVTDALFWFKIFLIIEMKTTNVNGFVFQVWLLLIVLEILLQEQVLMVQTTRLQGKKCCFVKQ